jgi:ActR/RegA family two-component response regulator
MHRLLLIDHDRTHAERLAARLRQRGLVVMIAEGIEEAAHRLDQRIPAYDLVVVIAAGLPDAWLGMLRNLVRASRQHSTGPRPFFLFVSQSKCNPRIRLRIERLGARYVRER